MPIPLPQKTYNLITAGLVISIAIHLILFSSFKFRFNSQEIKSTVQVTFLGAILDPFEVEKIKIQNSFSPRASVMMPNQNQSTSGRAATAIAKPNLSAIADNRRKTIFRSPPRPENARVEIPLDILKTEKNESLPQPYQRLKLYQ